MARGLLQALASSSAASVVGRDLSAGAVAGEHDTRRVVRPKIWRIAERLAVYELFAARLLGPGGGNRQPEFPTGALGREPRANLLRGALGTQFTTWSVARAPHVGSAYRTTHPAAMRGAHVGSSAAQTP